MLIHLTMALGAGAGWAPVEGAAPVHRPNVVFVVADDMGWRDTSYQGSPHAKTPNLDDMAAKGVRFDNFYAAQNLCSPGRFAILTGRAPFRTGLNFLGAMRPEEITLAKAMATAGYRTGHFGKWHLGERSTSPVKMGFDTAIWSENNFEVGGKLQIGDGRGSLRLDDGGDTSLAIMRLAVAFIREQAAQRRPFFVQICFSSPHLPHRAAEEFKRLYVDAPEGLQDFLGEVSGVDAAVGELRAELRALDMADNTVVWFTSDNGGITGESKDPTGRGKSSIGARTVSVLEWPARVTHPIRTSIVAAHMDMYPTVLEITGITMPGQPIIDGMSLVPVLDAKMTERPTPLGFMEWNDPKKKLRDIDFVTDTGGVWIDGRYKLVVDDPRRSTGSARLYDIIADPSERTNLATRRPDEVRRMRQSLDEWRRSVRGSFDGGDFSPSDGVDRRDSWPGNWRHRLEPHGGGPKR